MRPSLILLGLLLGLCLGVIYGWVISPVKYTNTAPVSLRADYKEQYLLLIAASYTADHNLDRARARLANLRDPNPLTLITALAQRRAAEGQDASALAALAADLAGGIALAPTPPAASATADLIRLTPTVNPPPTVSTAATLASFPTLAPTTVPEYDYLLLNQEQYCNEKERLPLIIVDVVDAVSAPLPGVRVTVKWAEGQDGFVTGLKPEISASYGDFLMRVGTAYSVQLGSRTPPVSGISASTCTDAESKKYPGAVRLVFQRK